MLATSRTEESIFAAALQQPSPTARSAYLDEACRNDAQLRDRVEKLLNSHSKAGSFLQVSIPVTTEPHLIERPGTIIGPYKLLQQIGEGGMGVVYMADQESPVRRRVALKIIKPGMDSRQVIARFEAERQALAMMDHQHIAKVLDAGTTESGRPYFVMELVHGVPLTKFCDENRLTLRQRLELFVPVCQAIQHAHQKGIIHRDIKPSNILVTMYDDKPVPKVIDFGVAKAVEQRLTERTLFTQYGTLVGTLEYMSPEQAEMNAFGVDTRSDIYSLGVLLYELLTGTTPLERSKVRDVAVAELVRLIKEEEPPRPSIRLSSSGALPKVAAACRTLPAQLSKLLQGELDWIVMKCLEKDRKRRYETASGLARDIERYLKDEPVEACPPSLSYRCGKVLRRHKGPAVAAGLLLLAMTAGIFGTTAGMIRADAERRRAIAAELDAVQKANETQRSEEHADRARGEAEVALKETKATNQRLLDSEEARRRDVYSARVNLISRAWEANNLRGVQDLLFQTRPAAGENDLRDFEWRYWQRQLHSERRSLALPIMHPSMPCMLSPNGNRLACVVGRGNYSLHVLDTVVGTEVFSRAVPLNCTCKSFAFNEDGSRLATVDHQWTAGTTGSVGLLRLCVWDINTRQLLRSWDLRKTGSLNPEAGLDRLGTRVVLAPHEVEPNGSDSKASRALTVWDVAGGQELFRRVLKSPLQYGGGILSSDGAEVAAAVVNDEEPIGIKLRVWNVLDEGDGRDVPFDGLRLTSFLFAPNKNRILLAGTLVEDDQEGATQIRNTATGDIVASWAEPGFGRYNHVAFSPDATRIALVSRLSPLLRVRDAETGKLIVEHKAHANRIDHVAFDQAGSQLLTVATHGELKEWNVSSPTSGGKDGKDAFEGVPDMAVSADGARFALLQRELQEIAVREVATGREIAHWPHNLRLPEKRDRAYSRIRICLSPNGERVAVLSGDRADPYAKVWDVASKALLLELGKEDFGGSPWYIQDLQPFTPDGNRLVIHTWNGRSESPTNELKKQIRVFDIAAGRQCCELSIPMDYSISAISVSPDGRSLAGAGMLRWNNVAAVWVWDIETGRIAHSFEHGSNMFSALAFHPDGTRLAAGLGLALNEKQGDIVLCDLTTGRKTHLLNGHARRIYDLAFTRDGRRLASFAPKADRGGGEVKLWDVESGQERLSLDLDDTQLAELAFSTDGRRLVVAALGRPEQASLKIWDATALPISVEARDLLERLSSDAPVGGWTNDEIISRLNDQKGLADDLRRAALAEIESQTESSQSFNERSWRVVQAPGQTGEAYRQALRDAERAASIAPDDGQIVNTLGAAQYRVGQFAEAKITLTRALKLNTDAQGEQSPADLAFLAMTCHQLRQSAEAKAHLERLRKRVSDPLINRIPVYEILLQEAESLVQSP